MGCGDQNRLQTSDILTEPKEEAPTEQRLCMLHQIALASSDTVCRKQQPNKPLKQTHNHK